MRHPRHWSGADNSLQKILSTNLTVSTLQNGCTRPARVCLTHHDRILQHLERSLRSGTVRHCHPLHTWHLTRTSWTAGLWIAFKTVETLYIPSERVTECECFEYRARSMFRVPVHCDDIDTMLYGISAGGIVFRMIANGGGRFSPEHAKRGACCNCGNKVTLKSKYFTCFAQLWYRCWRNSQHCSSHCTVLQLLSDTTHAVSTVWLPACEATAHHKPGAASMSSTLRSSASQDAQ